ncbi:NAD(P)-binding protein [Wolfiporia cocos MD-104 SS10]|uniref:NAD(P)-binding protein n=1 Tax=Wolfiporia cocos (strain MD-104) TaxID=742152 RepID=A0A2H3JGZ7_WOLCO|nr:NAD(P)-binding protein [Wolfiporia cocos MD-104 SS10]
MTRTCESDLLVNFFVLLGAIVAAHQLRRFIAFVWLYLLRPTTVHQYLHDPPAYALVTGATDGIGKAVAEELYSKGFNLILHGRNEQKLAQVVDLLRAREGRDVLTFLADATRSGHDFEHIMEPFRSLNITLVIHNVGGTFIRRERIDGVDEANLSKIVQWNDMFPLYLTRALLPQLRQSAMRGPVMVQFVGSQAEDVSPPTLAVYAASKAFLHALSRGLDNDERVWGTPSGVQFAYLAVGSVTSNSNRVTSSLVSPTASRFAKALVSRIGCGKRSYAPWLPHAAMQWLIELLPVSMVDRLVAAEMHKTIVANEKNT